MEQLDNIQKETTLIRIEVAKIAQHLKDINGSIKRHDKDLTRLDNDISQNKVLLAKVASFTGFGGMGVGGVAVYAVSRFMGI